MTSPSSPRRAVFLDRDGVINRSHVVNGKPYAPRQLADFRLLPGAAAAVDDLAKSGFLVFVVTNQPDIGNRLVEADVVEAMHERIRQRLKVVEIFCCPHRQDEGCDCRKPAAGFLLAAAARYSLDLPASYMVGDRSSDIEAGKKAGCNTIFINRGYTEGLRVHPDATVGSLAAAARHILATDRAAP